MSEEHENKPLKKTERLELLKKQLEELENEEEEQEDPVILEKQFPSDTRALQRCPLKPNQKRSSAQGATSASSLMASRSIGSAAA